MAVKKEVIRVDGTTIYCDACGGRGPQMSYENTEGVLEEAENQGWATGEDRDLCPGCVAKNRKRKKT